MVDCCKHKSYHKTCKRKDGKIFKIPRKFSKSKCINSRIKGFTMRASCAPYSYCKTFLYNPNDPKRSYNVYIDKNPENTISIKYASIDDVQKTISKLERLYKKGKYEHKRIKQVAMIMMVRLRVLKKTKPLQYKLSKIYHNFLFKRTGLSQLKRKELTFSMN